MRIEFLFVEVAAIVLFLAGLRQSMRSGRTRAFEFALIAVYGIILEYLDMKFFKSYHYSPDFLLSVHGVPVSIALLWAVIVAGSMAISDATGIPVTARPFLDGVLAVWIDLALDAIAIRMGYWSWRIPLNEGWFGVPAGNLYAWIWVAFFYSVLARAVRALIEKDRRWTAAYIAVPFISYILLFVQLHVAGWAGRMAGLATANQRLWLFAAQFGVFLLISGFHLAKNANPLPPAFFWTAARFFMHVYFIICYFLFGFHHQTPSLGWIAAAVLAAELVFIKTVFRRQATHG